MIKKINHIAIAVPDLQAAIHQYETTLGGKVSPIIEEGEHGVMLAFVELDNSKIELLHPLSDDSPIAKFLEKNPHGGIHHICYEVNDIMAAKEHLEREGAKILGDGTPKIGAHGKRVLFLHPKDFNGCLIELEEI